MKKFLLVAAIVISMASCSGNANLQVGLSDAVNAPQEKAAEIVYRGYDFTVYRIYVDGVRFLVNTEGGIVKE